MMTSELAKHIAEELRDKHVGGWQVGKMRNHGGTAVVLEATRGEEIGALKIYSRELVKKDKSKHVERLNRQLSLRDHTHPQLVRVLDAGECTQTDYLYVVMELITYPTLEEVARDVPRDKIRHVISQVAKAALYLHERELVHRDIKPSNIALSLDTLECKLLDLGVVRPILGDTITDDTSGSRFLGTKRYAPPEFFAEAEEHTPEAWTAITFYQLGAVLHDLIMRRSIFDPLKNKELEQAVLFQVPTISADDVAPDLVQLARDCLQKDPALRRRFVTWERFLRSTDTGDRAGQVEEAVQRLAARRMGQVNPIRVSPRPMESSLRSIEQAVDSSLRTVCIDSESFPPLTVESSPLDLSRAKVVQRASLKYELAGMQPVWVNLTFVTTVLDPISMAVEILIATSISVEVPPLHSEFPLHRKLFAGTFDPGSLHAVIAREIPLEIDYAISEFEKLDGIPGSSERFLLARPSEATA